MPDKKERQTFDSGKATPEVQPGPTTVPEVPESNSAAQERTRGIGGIRTSRARAEMSSTVSSSACDSIAALHFSHLLSLP